MNESSFVCVDELSSGSLRPLVDGRCIYHLMELCLPRGSTATINVCVREGGP